MAEMYAKLPNLPPRLAAAWTGPFDFAPGRLRTVPPEPVVVNKDESA